MKLTINPSDGTITVDTADNISAAQFVRELLSGHASTPAPKAIESKPVKKGGWSDEARAAAAAARRRKAASRKKKLAPPRADRPLSKTMDETWAWLAASDRADGITAEEVAEAFGISKAGGYWRINALIKRDMAWRVGPGRYRVGSVADAEIMLNGKRS